VNGDDNNEQIPLVILDERRFKKALADNPNNKIAIFKDALFGCQTQLNNQFFEGAYSRQLVTERARLIDRMLVLAWEEMSWSKYIALIAVGGYGRGELHPHSDIDLLILTQDANQQDLEQIQQFITFLWDIQLEIGHSVRSLKECIALAQEDITIATNLLESRTLSGNRSLLRKLRKATSKKKMWRSKEFFKAKWQEQMQRHKQVSGSEYSLEPNIKQAPGGLRDIQMISWIAKRHFGVNELMDLSNTGFITNDEYLLLRSGKDFLYKVRYGLHVIAGRAQERLHIDHQRELAKVFGYKDSKGRMAVEHFMRDYYRAVISCRELNDLLLHLFIEELEDRFWRRRTRKINDSFIRHNNAIEARDDDLFLKEPRAILEVFALLAEDSTLIGVRAKTIRLMREARSLINHSFIQQPENADMFMRILKAPGPLFAVLTKMNRYRVLGKYLPEFGQVIGLMQHDLFHIYTVDAHTLKLIDMIDKFRFGKSEDEFPLATKIVRNLEKPELLYIAALYHDIAKGRGGNHSELGTVDAIEFCQRHNLSTWETKLIEFLVRHHLLMSSISQRQDITDPDVVYKFATQLGDQLYLDYLYALTVADVNATNPELWNTWKASLLRQLYNATKSLLRSGIEQPMDLASRVEEKQRRVIDLLKARGIDRATAQEFWREHIDDYFLRERARDIAWHVESYIDEFADKDTMVLVQKRGADEFDGSTQIFVRTVDQPKLFAKLVRTLVKLQLRIQDARIYSCTSGKVLDTFFVLDSNGKPLDDTQSNHARIITGIKDALADTTVAPSKLSQRIPRVKKHFANPTRVVINNDLSDYYTSIEIITPDRPGLLSIVADVFAEYDLQLINAKIATLGERVEDVFYVTDEHHNQITDLQLLEQVSETIQDQLDEHVEEFHR